MVIDGPWWLFGGYDSLDGGCTGGSGCEHAGDALGCSCAGVVVSKEAPTLLICY